MDINESKKYEQTWKDWAHLRNDKSELVVKWAKECGIEVCEFKPSQVSDVEDDLTGLPILDVNEKGTVSYCPPRYVPAGRKLFMKDISNKITPEQVDEACKLLEGYVGHELTEDFKTFWEADRENKK